MLYRVSINIVFPGDDTEVPIVVYIYLVFTCVYDNVYILNQIKNNIFRCCYLFGLVFYENCIIILYVKYITY